MSKLVDAVTKAAKQALALQIRHRFCQKCVENGLMPPVAEYTFHPTRKWRFDYSWPESKVALEVEGGVWTGGRHTRGYGFVKDCEKYNNAVVMGWRLIRIQPRELMLPATISMLKQMLPKQDGPTAI